MVNTINTSDELDQKEKFLKRAKEIINEQISSTLYYGKKPDEEIEKSDKINENDNTLTEENSDDEEDKSKEESIEDSPLMHLINFIKWEYQVFEWDIKSLLIDEELDENKENFLFAVFKNAALWKKPSFYKTVKILREKGVGKEFTFDQIYALSQLSLDDEALQHFIDIIHTIDLVTPEKDIDYLIDNPELFTQEIINKIDEIKEINEELEYSYGHWIDLNIFDIKKLQYIEITESLKEKIYKIFNIENPTLSEYLDIEDFKILDKIDINEDLIDKLNKLSEQGMNIYAHSLAYISKIDVNEDLIKKMKYIKNLGITLYSNDLSDINNINLDNWNEENLKYYIRKIWKTEENELNIRDLWLAASLNKEEIDKDLEISKKLWLGNKWLIWIRVIHNLPEEVIEYCNKNDFKEIWDIYTAKAFYSLANKDNIRWYIERKDKFSQEKKLLSDEKYTEYFWWKWKFDKDDIRQWWIGLCYMYTCLELFKRMNWFNIFIQSNFIEDEDWWKIRLPLNTWDWIKIHKEEIDKKYKLKYGESEYKRTVSINSDSELLWTKILEIAFIKKLIQNKEEKDFKWDWSKNNPLDIDVTRWRLKDIEWWDTIETLWVLFWYSKILRRDLYNPISAYKKLKKVNAPSFIVNKNKKNIKYYKARTEKLFEFYKTWFIAANIWLSNMYDEWIILKDVKIVDKYWKEMNKEELEDEPDIIISNNWKITVELLSRHAYSLEKCYIDKDWNKIVRIANPRHTEIKFDIPFKIAQEIFKWEVWAILIDELFKEENSD